MSEFNSGFGKKIKQMRESRHVSQEEFAEELGIPRSSLSQIENGKRDVKTGELIKIASFFNISVDQLLDLKKEPEVFFEDSKAEDGEEQDLRIDVPQKNIKKFKEVFLYILNRIGSKPNIGETVLYKLLYFIDFDFYEIYEEQLIGATYIKNRHGPTPVEFKKIVEQMIKNEEVFKVKDRYFNYPRTKYLPLRFPDLSVLKAHEIMVIDKVLSRLSDLNAVQISEYSHNDVPWLTTEDREIIAYETVFYRTSPYSQRPG